MAPPVTYTVDGQQYLTVLAGWGGNGGLGNGGGARGTKPGYGRILTFALNGSAVLNVLPFGHKDPPVPAIAEKQDPATVRKGAFLFATQCGLCHGSNAVAGALPDLRYSSKEVLDSLDSIVLEGGRAANGMPSFKEIYTAEDVKAIRSYIVARSQKSATAIAGCALAMNTAADRTRVLRR